MQRQLADGQSSILPVYMGAQASLIQEIFMQVVNFSHFSSRLSYLTPLLSPINMLAAWLAKPASACPLVPPANAPLAHQRLTLPFSRARNSHRNRTTGRVSSFNSAAFEPDEPEKARLRIVREHDAAVGSACAGRMTISGRMADVCAELERMAQLETAQ
jgi:hypothetical protein